jgi:predicted esterase
MPTHDPSASGNQAALAGIPVRLIYSTNDPVILPANVSAYRDLLLAAGVGVTMSSQGAVGHSTLGLDHQDPVNFFQAHP